MTPAPVRHFAAVLDALADALILLDRQGVLLHMNAAALEVLGLEPALLLGQRLEAICTDPTEHIESLLRRCARSRQLMPGGFTLKPPARPQGRVHFEGALVHHADGAAAILVMRLKSHADAVDRFIELTRRIDDLTREIERRRSAERLLDEQREWMRTMLRSIGDAVVATDIEGRITFMNPMAEVLTGWAEAEATGQAIEQVVTVAPEFGGDGASESPVHRALREQHTAALASHGVLTRRDGAQRPVDDIAAPIIDDAGRVLGAVLIFRDVSDRVAVDMRRRSLEIQLRDMHKTQALGTLAGGIAHDFNNVLGSILGNTALASDELDPGHVARERIAQIDVAARRARRLVKQILTFSRRQPQHLQHQPLRPIIEEVVAMLRSTVPAVARIDACLPDAALCVEADATQLHQVLMNLGTNAWQALRGSTGCVEIGCEQVNHGATRNAGVEAPPPPGAYVRVWVRDTGCGMDGATRARMFEPFFTTKPVHQGTGLGLSVVQGIVAEHHGGIDVDSAPGAGTTISIYLPEAAADESMPKGVATGPVERGRGEHVLYVDDDPIMVIISEALLRRAGYAVTVHSDPHAALACVKAQPDTFDLAITDYNMPGMTGLDLASALRAQNASMPIVITSGHVSPELRRQARGIVRCTLLNKEELPDEVCGLVARLLAGRAMNSSLA